MSDLDDLAAFLSDCPSFEAPKTAAAAWGSLFGEGTAVTRSAIRHRRRVGQAVEMVMNSSVLLPTEEDKRDALTAIARSVDAVSVPGFNRGWLA